jgi:16S rRNA (adenine1518-N6/adenine1519-N6)-dimethyltransferase
MLPKKRFGQNFLHDRSVIQKIITAINPQPSEHFVEIGSGRGALTVHLLPLTAKLDALELDRDLIPELTTNCKEFKNLLIHQADALEFDFKTLIKNEKLRVVGNLPYNISTPLIFHLLEQISVIQDMHFMLQKEVAERIAAASGSKIYGRLSVMVQYFCQTELLFKVKPAAFYPAPKVDSCFLRLVPHKKIPYPAKDISLFQKIVKQAFGQRRKTITNSLRGLITSEQLISLGIDPKLRAENLGVADFVKICNNADCVKTR